MGRGCFQKIIFCLFCCVLPWNKGMANCPLADKYLAENKKEKAVLMWQNCAIRYNDDESQLLLADRFLTGEDGLEKDEAQALYMYHLAAESGNAKAQLKLAHLLRDFDSSPERRKQLVKYQEQLLNLAQTDGDFVGEIYHPYTLMLLAAEKPENKWYYPSLERTPPETATADLKKYQLASPIQQAALKDASKWKSRKLLEVAKEVLSSDEYIDFENRFKNAQTRSSAMEELKQKYQAYIEEVQRERMGLL